jgi:hypothetical protein
MSEIAEKFGIDHAEMWQINEFLGKDIVMMTPDNQRNMKHLNAKYLAY